MCSLEGHWRGLVTLFCDFSIAGMAWKFAPISAVVAFTNPVHNVSEQSVMRFGEQPLNHYKIGGTPVSRKFLFIAGLACLNSLPLMAADSVSFTMKAHMPTLNDDSAQDTFTVTLADKQIETTFNVKCEAPKSGFIGGRDRSCAVAGNGELINPSNGQKLQRTQYSGGWVVKSSGYTDGTTMAANYLAIGQVGASSSGFGGSMMLKPETPSSGAIALRDSVLSGIKSNLSAQQSKLIDTRVDTVQFSGFTMPSAGYPSDKGCVWNGDMIFAYQTNSWFMDLKPKCNGKEYELKGNMPFTLTPNVANQHQYDLTLMLPDAAAASDSALFAKPTGDTALFQTADGITGQIIMKESGYVDYKSEGQTDKLPIDIDATGTLTGQNVSLETVRSFGTIIAILSRTFFGP